MPPSVSVLAGPRDAVRPAGSALEMSPDHRHTLLLQRVLEAVNEVVRGQPRVVRSALIGLLAGGHLLLEGPPGVGKSTLAQTLARVLGLDCRRQSFVSDLLPADLLGSMVWRAREERAVFERGPIFSEIFIADEINRASPRTQSALLEAMEAREVSIEGSAHKLPELFSVVATCNPTSQVGTQELPESQLDRFLFCIGVDYPQPQAELELLLGAAVHPLPALRLTAAAWRELRAEATRVAVSEEVARYVLRIVSASRTAGGAGFKSGLSPRAGCWLLRAAASLEGRAYVLPDDVQEVFVPLARHRLQWEQPSPGAKDARLAAWLGAIPVLERARR